MRTTTFIILFIHSVCCFGQVEQNAGEAFKISAETHKPVLLIFSGSDWCAPCIRLAKNVLTENAFLTFAHENLVVLKADFPQRKKLSNEEQEQNDLLAERYNPNGIFPRLVLIRGDKSVLSILAYNNQTPEEFILELKESLSK